MTIRRWSLRLVLLVVVFALPVAPADGAPRAPGSTLITVPRPAADLAGFGSGVAISGDTAVVVAIRTDPPSGPEEQGQAFVYSRGPRGWSPTPVATLTAPSASGEFGAVVTLAGTTLAISDPNTTPESVYLYTEGADGWPTTPSVTETDPDAYPGDRRYDAFGATLAVSGTTLMIGAANVEGNGDGVVYTYTEGPGGWPTTPTATLTDPGGSPTNASNDGFGEDLAVSGTTAMIGAYGTGGDGEPLVYEYTRGADGWPATPTVTLADPQPSNYCFGETGLAVAGTTALIGDGCERQAKGVVYAYQETAFGWGASPVATIHDPAPGRSNYFGIVEAMSDGTAVVGAWGFHKRQGRAYVYAMDDDGGWNTTPVMTLQDPARTEQDAFGIAVGLSGSSAIIGAENADSSRNDDDSGLAYLAEV